LDPDRFTTRTTEQPHSTTEIDHLTARRSDDPSYVSDQCRSYGIGGRERTASESFTAKISQTIGSDRTRSLASQRHGHRFVEGPLVDHDVDERSWTRGRGERSGRCDEHGEQRIGPTLGRCARQRTRKDGSALGPYRFHIESEFAIFELGENRRDHLPLRQSDGGVDNDRVTHFGHLNPSLVVGFVLTPLDTVGVGEVRPVAHDLGEVVDR
jgi:hypothetical protein